MTREEHRDRRMMGKERNGPSGEWRCPECDFRLHSRVIDAVAGVVGVPRVQAVPDCANGCGTMAPRTWKELCESYGKTIDRLNERLAEQEVKNEQLRECIDNGHAYGEEPDCSRCGHYGPGDADAGGGGRRVLEEMFATETHAGKICGACKSRVGLALTLYDMIRTALGIQDVQVALGPEALADEPVCFRCKDTHLMDLDGRKVMCTSCPVPCDLCRSGGKGAFCAETPCPCDCHATTKEGT